MDLKSFSDLLTPSGQQALIEAVRLQPREDNYLAHFQALSRKIPAPLAQAALEIAIQRLRAAKKHPSADRLYFTREALEQASAYPVAAHRANRYHAYNSVIDMACSAGGDSLALAEHTRVIGLDNDPLRLAMARANLAALGWSERADWLQADLRQPPLDLRIPMPRMAAFCDPARRADGRRIFSVERYSPPLSVVAGWQRAFPALGVKISPGVNLTEVKDYAAEIEFISLHGELKECVLWFGPLRSSARTACLLPGEYRLCLQPGEALPVLPVSQPCEFIYEPDPAILRAGLVGLVGSMLNASQLDPDIAYLTGITRIETPFARAWRILDWFPFNLKRLRAYLRERCIGYITLKKRGSPMEPEALIRQLRLEGENQALLFLTHLRGEQIVILAEE
jgi:SAM-dependent methyltransferase